MFCPPGFLFFAANDVFCGVREETAGSIVREVGKREKAACVRNGKGHRHPSSLGFLSLLSCQRLIRVISSLVFFCHCLQVAVAVVAFCLR